jgi:hypothetical protein
MWQVDIPFSRARRFTGLGQRAGQTKRVLVYESFIIIDRPAVCENNHIIFQQIYQISVDVFKRVNNFSVGNEACIYLKVEHLLIAGLFT